MYNNRMGSYDEIPDGMKAYINNYGCHFNKKLCDEAARRMYTEVDGKKKYITPYTKEQVEEILSNRNVKLTNNKLYDAVYVANMCKADYLGKSVIDEVHLALFIQDVLDDPDGAEGLVFNRFYADTVFTNNPIEWWDML